MRPLKSLKANDVAPVLKKMLGPGGEVAALPPGNVLFLRDRVGNLRQVVKALKEMEKGPDPSDR